MRQSAQQTQPYHLGAAVLTELYQTIQLKPRQCRGLVELQTLPDYLQAPGR